PRIHRLTPELVGAGVQSFDALGPGSCAWLCEEDRRAGRQPTVPPQGPAQRQTATLIRQLHGNNCGVGTRPVLLLERIERRRRPEHGVPSRRQDGLQGARKNLVRIGEEDARNDRTDGHSLAPVSGIRARPLRNVLLCDSASYGARGHAARRSAVAVAYRPVANLRRFRTVTTRRAA